jgi:1-acyl-sn-glycerol-3-phosphate acyltransferase
LSDGRTSSGRRSRSSQNGRPTNGGGREAVDDGVVRSARERIAQTASPAAFTLGSLARSAAGVAAGVAGTIAEKAAARVPKADLDERDPDYIRENLPGQWLLASLYFRAEVRGLHFIPEEGGVLLVGNHSGGNLTPDSIVLSLAFNTYFGVERGFYQLAHNLVVSMPYLGFMRKFGTVAANRENAHAALAGGNALLVYPGGDYEVHRPTWESAKVDFGGRKGFIRQALEEDVPLVPVVSIGGQETALFLSRGEWLAKLLRLDKMFRLKVLPISLALPWGLNVGDMFSHIPLPAKITVEVMPAIDLREEFGENPDLDEVYESITTRMQATLTSLDQQRSLPFFG